MRSARRSITVTALALALSMAGCGPLRAALAIDRAADRMRAADTARLRTRDPYAYFTARSLLEKARDQTSVGQHQRAALLADEAERTLRDALSMLDTQDTNANTDSSADAGALR